VPSIQEFKLTLRMTLLALVAGISIIGVRFAHGADEVPTFCQEWTSSGNGVVYHAFGEGGACYYPYPNSSQGVNPAYTGRCHTYHRDCSEPPSTQKLAE